MVKLGKECNTPQQKSTLMNKKCEEGLMPSPIPYEINKEVNEQVQKVPDKEIVIIHLPDGC